MRTHPAVLVLLPAAALLAACGSSASSAPAARPLLVRTAPVQARDIQQRLVLTGTLRPRAQVQVVAEVAGRLVKVVREEGASVRAGELLAQIDPTDYQLSTQRARAALAVAEANRAHAVVEKERADNLVRTGGITDKDHLAAQVGLQVAEAALAQARADAAIAGQQLARAAVRAPFSGRVARRMVDAGAMLAAGAPLFTVVDDSVLEFRASVPSADYAKVTVGAPVEVALDGRPEGTPVRGRVARVTPLVDERTRSFEAVVEVPGGPGLVGGVFARASVRFAELKGALVVPPSALVRSGGSDQAQVFLVKDGKAERRAVTLGTEQTDAVQVSSGLSAGEVVILEPPAVLAPGAAVQAQGR